MSKSASVPTNAGRVALMRFVVAAIMLSSFASSSHSQLPENVKWPVVDGLTLRRHLIVPQVPHISIGTADGPEHTLLAGVVGAIRLPDGSVAIGDAGNNRVLFFSKTGDHVRSVGRSGGGPGEYRQPQWLGRCANGNLAYHDGNQRRVTFLSPEGAYRGALPLPAGIHFDPIVWCSGHRDFFYLYNRARDPVRKGEIERVPAALVHVTARDADTVWKGGIQEYYVGMRAPGVIPLPLGEATLAAAAVNRVYVCVNLTARCTVFDSTGVTVNEFTINLSQRRPSSDAWVRARDDMVASMPTRALKDLASRVLGELPPRRNDFPVIDQVSGDQNGNLWVRTLDNYDTGWAMWLVVSERGVPVAAAAMPRGLRVLEIGTDYVLGLTQDQDGAERVELRMFSPFAR